MRSQPLPLLFDALDIQCRGGTAGDVMVRDLTDDSRNVQSGYLFIARSPDPAHTRQAIERGAVAILARPDLASQLANESPSSVAWYTATSVGQPLAGAIAERFFEHPSRKLTLIGVTGTNGKTTTAFIIQHLLRGAGVACGMIGTVWIDDGNQRRPAELTTPGAIEMSRLLAELVDHGCRAVVAEVSSHALHQGRTAALDFDTAVFTNLTGDHLDYHDTLDDYAVAKAVLFEQLSNHGWAVLNRDDPSASRMSDRCKAPTIWCSLAESPTIEPDVHDTICHASVLHLAADHSRARFDGPWGSVEVKLPLVGRHNVANALHAAAAANTVTPLARTLRQGLERCPTIPGRLERVRIGGAHRQPVVFVDYAHTHDALENVLGALQPLAKGRLVVVFGCGGDRDRTKRPKMATAACRFGDRVFVTSDNPRTEDPMRIIDDAIKGVPDDARAKVTVEADRAAAIAAAIAEASDDDTVLVAGKGHEDYQIVGTAKRYFDDREQAADALRRRLNRSKTTIAG